MSDTHVAAWSEAVPRQARWWLRLALLVSGAVLLVVGGLYYLGSEPQVLALETDAPQSVPVGEPFTTTLTIRNRTNSPQTLISLGLDEALLDAGLEVRRAVPSFRTERAIPGSRWHEYIFSLALRPRLMPDETLSMRLELVATRPGRYSGTLVLWTENRLRADGAALQLEAVPAD